MNNLMIFENKEIEGVRLSNQNGQVVVSSRKIAEDFGKRHDSVLRDIDRTYRVSTKLWKLIYRK